MKLVICTPLNSKLSFLNLINLNRFIPSRPICAVFKRLYFAIRFAGAAVATLQNPSKNQRFKKK